MTLKLFLLAVLISVLGRVIGEDAKSLIPRFSALLLRRAALRLNGAYSAGYYEEWLAHLEDTPELTLKLWHALSIYTWGAGRIGREIGYADAAMRRYDRIKRAMDLVFALMTGFSYAPFILAAAITAKHSGCIPFVAREIVGRNGRRVRVWKIGTLREIRGSEMDVFWKTDKRWRFLIGSDHFVVPPVGRFLRRSRFDEVPFIWSVLKGDLSLVGPQMLTARQRARYQMEEVPPTKPGISGLSQLHMAFAATELDLEKLDQEYSNSARCSPT